MNLKFYKPRTASQRFLVRLSNKLVSKTPLLKSNLSIVSAKAGRNNSGKITVYHKGGGTKKRYRNLFHKTDNKYNCIVTSIEYDPYRSANIASIYCSEYNVFGYIIAPLLLKVGDCIVINSLNEIRLGYRLSLESIPIGTFIHNISINAFDEGSLAKSAGSYAVLVEKFNNNAVLKLSSQKYKKVNVNCMASLGIVSNPDFFLTNIGKAGRARWLNKRPTVRGVAMNPIDHPHGGGEGKTSGGRSSVTPWGKPTKSKKKV